MDDITSAVIWRDRENYRVAGGDFRGAFQFFLMSCDLPILRGDRLVDRGDRLVDRGDRLVDRDRRIKHP